MLVDDCDVFQEVLADDLWCLDKLILARKLGYLCGPAGVAPPVPNHYIVRPIWNMRMMSRGASVQYLTRDSIQDGYFWCEVFSGRHRSFDYEYGRQTLGVEGFRKSGRLDRFHYWTRIMDEFKLPQVLEDVAKRYRHFNVEAVGDKIIEAHFRYNDDFHNHSAQTVRPVWQDEFYSSPCGDRLGFIKE
jgi:hypothetical protein